LTGVQQRGIWCDRATNRLLKKAGFGQTAENLASYVIDLFELGHQHAGRNFQKWAFFNSLLKPRIPLHYIRAARFHVWTSILTQQKLSDSLLF
jgi:hypothetical protein